MGRHSVQRGTPPATPAPASARLRWAAVAMAVVAAAVVTVVLVRVTGGGSSGPTPTTSRAVAVGSGETCASSVTVVSASSFAPALQRIAEGIANGPTCVGVRVVVADGKNAESVVGSSKADAWIADDASWSQLPGPAKLATGGAAGQVVATSPVYFVTQRGSTLPDADHSWLGLARTLAQTGPWKLTVRDPAGSGDGMVPLGGLAEALLNSDGPLISALDLLRTWTAAATVTTSAPALPTQPGQVGLVPEYALLHAGSLDRYSVVSPSDGTGLLRYTWHPTAAAEADPSRAASLDRLRAALEGKKAAAALTGAGLRGADWPAAAPPAAAVAELPVQTGRAMPTVSEHFMYHVLATWNPELRRSNMLLVIDVSGSMADPAPGSPTPKIALVRQGVGQVVQLLPDDALLGLWQFGSRLQPPQDWQQLVAPAPLGAGQRAALTAAGNGLQAKVTGTGLFDTVLAAYQYQQAHFQPDMPNEVVVFTDGIDEDDPGGISAQQLHDGLAATDASKRVQLSLFGIGSTLPSDSLTAALAPVGGQVDLLNSPDEVSGGFVHAVSGALSGVPG